MYGNASKIAVNATCGNNFNKVGLPHVYIALFRCLWVPGGGLEPFMRVLRSEGKPTVRTLNFSFYRFRIYQQAKIELSIFDITRFCQNPCLTQVKFGQNASELPFASLERVLALNVSHKNDSIFTPMNVYIFSYQ